MPHYDYDKDYPFAAFITNLGKYNEGALVGEWVKFPTTAEQFLEFEKNVDCFVLEPDVKTLEDLGWEYLDEKLTIDLTDDLRAAIDSTPFGRRALEEDRGCFTSRGYLFPTDDAWQHDRPQAKEDRKPSIKERLEQSKQECRNKNKAQAPHKGKSEPEL